jgi:hypothetical protein
LERRVVAVEETLETEHGIVSALGRVEQIRRWVPRVVARLVEVEGLEDRNLWTVTLHAPQDQGRGRARGARESASTKTYVVDLRN